MLSNSGDKLFGGLNSIISEQYKKMKEASVSDSQKSTHQLNEKEKIDPKEIEKVEKEIEKVVDSLKEGCSEKKMDEESYQESCEKKMDESSCSDNKMDEESCDKKMEESQDYETCMNKEDFIRRTKELGLNLEQEGDHTIAKTVNDDMKAWWNEHTGVGYIRKDHINPIHEDFQNIEEKSLQEQFIESLSEDAKSQYSALSDSEKVSFHRNEFEKIEESAEEDNKDMHLNLWRTLLKEEIKKGNA